MWKVNDTAVKTVACSAALPEWTVSPSQQGITKMSIITSMCVLGYSLTEGFLWMVLLHWWCFDI